MTHAQDTVSGPDANSVTIAEKVAFLSRPDAYPAPPDAVEVRETSKSWVFLAGDRAYKLKKPVRSPFLDFTTLARREAACKAELRLNRRLAAGTYVGLTPLTLTPQGLRLGGEGETADWLVVMRRLDTRAMLDTRIREDRLDARQLDRLADTLAHFYAHARPVGLSPDAFLAGWKHSLALTRRELLAASMLGLPSGSVRRLARIHLAFLATRQTLFAQRVLSRRVVDAHGDLRPEHIWLGEPIQIIDCLEFNDRLRAADTLAEVAFLDLECERLGAAWAGASLRGGILGRERGGQTDDLYTFYRSAQATLRARLAIAHLRDPHPRTPEKWRPLALTYLRLALKDADRLEAALRTPGVQSRSGSHSDAGRYRREAARRGECLPCCSPRCRSGGKAARYR